MKIVIEIPDHVYEHAKNMSEDSNDEWDAMRAIAKGFPYEERPHGEINTNQNPCINCCVKYSCKGICEKRYLWNLRKEGEAAE